MHFRQMLEEHVARTRVLASLAVASDQRSSVYGFGLIINTQNSNAMKRINWRKVLHYVVTILTSIVTTLTTTSCR